MSRNYRNTPTIQRLKRRINRRFESRQAVLGDGAGTIDAGVGLYWVRFPAAVADDGNTLYSPPIALPCDVGATFYVTNGARIWCGYDEHGELVIKKGDRKDIINWKRDPKATNPLRPEMNWIRLSNCIELASRPLGTEESAATTVNVYPLFYDDEYGDLNYYEGTPRAADKIDLAAYIPAAGYQRVVVLFLKTFDNTIQVTYSTQQDLDTEFDETDYQECFAQRDAETIPIQGYKLADNQTTVTISSLGLDVRQWLNVPNTWGFPNPVDMVERIRSGRTVSVHGVLTVTGTLTVHGELWVV